MELPITIEGCVLNRLIDYRKTNEDIQMNSNTTVHETNPGGLIHQWVGINAENNYIDRVLIQVGEP